MQRKNKSSQQITKTDLESALKKYATKEDLKLELKFSADEILEKVDENARTYRDQILTSNDKLAKTLETIREDLEIGSFQTRERVEDHEKRIKNLEKVQQTV